MISFDRFMDINPRVEYFPGYDTRGEFNEVDLQGIKALAYDGADYKGMHTKVFAHIGFPERAEDPVPAIVLIHGGGGHPEDVWIKKWNEKGYAAIAMDTTGYFPAQPIPHLREGFAEGLKRELIAPFAEEGYTVTPDNSGMSDCTLPIEHQWMYQAVAAVILAHNILRNDSRVDSSKIGICGISWGGIITSIAIGYDTRFAFAVPIYGSGYLGIGLSDIDKIFQTPESQKWLAEKRFDKVKMPVMWLGWNDDGCFSIQSNSMSYLVTKEQNNNTCLSMRHKMMHSHCSGYTPRESYWFANEVLSGNKIPEVEARFTDNKVYYTCSAKAKEVRLFYINEKMLYIQREKYGDTNSYMKQEWQIMELDPENTLDYIPENAVGKYVEFTLENGVILTTPYTE